MSEHTPGPWGIVFHGDVERIRLNGSTVYQVSDVTDPEFPSGKPRYNVDDLRLMAAAPALLSALKAHLPWDEDYGPVRGWGIWQDAVDAINKAEGKGE
jgi:hypothetical protein